MAIKHRQLVLIHTPHLRDKLKGTMLTLDLLRSFGPTRSVSGSTMWKSTRSKPCWTAAIGPA